MERRLIYKEQKPRASFKQVSISKWAKHQQQSLVHNCERDQDIFKRNTERMWGDTRWVSGEGEYVIKLILKLINDIDKMQNEWDMWNKHPTQQ